MDFAKITFFGAARRVTGSCSLLQMSGKNILIDCGLIQGDDEANELNREPFDFEPKSIDAVVLTHGHLDHCGRLPRLLNAGYKGPIYAHGASAELAEIVWRDSARLSGKDGDPLYEDDDIDRTLAKIQPQRYKKPVEIGPLSISFYDAGHILGSSHVLFTAPEGRILFSGDIGQGNTPIIRDPTTDWPGPVDAVVIESTYGTRLHKNREDTVKEFKEIVLRSVKHKGMILIPAFAIGRTQELLYQFNKMVQAGELPRVPVLLDSPMAEKVTAIYRKHQECYDEATWKQIESGDLPMTFDGLRELETSDESKKVKQMAPPAIVIAGSGMCTGGRILHHLKNFLDRDSTTVIFVGWQGYKTLGRRLVDGADKVKLYGQEVSVKARIETLGGFSAHADGDALMRWAKHIPGPPKHFLVNHGEEDAAQDLVQALIKNGFPGAVAVEDGHSYDI